MRIDKKACALVVLLGLATFSCPQTADAKASGGGSVGSRGTHTYQAMPHAAPQAQPITRSMTAPPTYRPAPVAPPAPMMQPAFAPQPSFFSAHPFMASMAGSFLGVGLADMIFGHGATAAGVGGATATATAADTVGSGIGSLLQILLLVGLGYFIYRLFRSRDNAPMASAMPSGLSFMAQPPVLEGVATPVNDAPLAITQQDYQAFQTALEKIQLSWGQGDLAHLRQHVTPEMLQYFNEELSRNASNGQINKVENVKLLAGDLIESWAEDDLDYATVRLKWSAVDYRARLDKQPSESDYVISGSPTQPTEAEEIWTFARAKGGRWMLSAIQQGA